MTAVQHEPIRILVTGANGFVGRHLMTALLAPSEGEYPEVQIAAGVHGPLSAAPAEPFGAVGWQGRPVNDSVTAVELDIRDAASVQSVFAEFRPQQVYHLAARASGADADREAVHAVNVQGTRHLLEAARSLSPAPRVLLISTGYVYGNTDPDAPARETDPLAAPGKYGLYADSKIAMEETAREFADFAFVARAFAHTGPGQPPNFAIPAFARQFAAIERGEQPPKILVGNLDACRDLLDVRDVVNAYVRLMAEAQPGEFYNVANGSPVSMRHILDELRRLCTVPTEVEIDPSRLRPADIACSTGNSDKLRDLIFWRPARRLSDTLQDTLAYWRSEVS